MEFLSEFKNKGYFYQCTDEKALFDLMQERKIAAYIGFDCTAKSLHVGNLMQIMILRLLQQHGHKPIILVGGGTTKVGDPSGKDELRRYLGDEELAENIQGIKKSLSKFINFGTGPNDAIMVNNNDWLNNLKYIDFLRDYGRHFSVNRMLTMDSVRLRLERQQPLTFLEFNYMLLQSYDFMYLNKNHDCMLQIGGSDQWGNIISGVDLVRKINANSAFGLTTPLLTTASGAKMGKTADGAVWLNEDQLSPYEYFQFWRNSDDADIVRFAGFYAEYNDDQMQEFTKLAAEKINDAKKQLAYRLTELCHGENNAKNALETSIKTFEQGAAGDSLPSMDIKAAAIEANIIACELLHIAGLAPSKGEARRLIRGRGVKINDILIEDENQIIDMNFVKNAVIKLSVGKKKHMLLKISR